MIEVTAKIESGYCNSKWEDIAERLRIRGQVRDDLGDRIDFDGEVFKIKIKPNHYEDPNSGICHQLRFYGVVNSEFLEVKMIECGDGIVFFNGNKIVESKEDMYALRRMLAFQSYKGICVDGRRIIVYGEDGWAYDYLEILGDEVEKGKIIIYLKKAINIERMGFVSEKIENINDMKDLKKIIKEIKGEKEVMVPKVFFSERQYEIVGEFAGIKIIRQK